MKVVGANRRSLRPYDPQPFATRLAFLKAADTLQENDAAWDRLSLGGAEVHRIPGDHLSIHFPPQVETLAATLAGCIERALEETETVEEDREI